MKLSPYTYRYNPIEARWVMVGPPIPPPERLEAKPPKDRKQLFSWMAYPRDLFVVEPVHTRKQPPKDTVYLEQQPVGEYEVLLYHGDTDTYQWTAKEWKGWLELVQSRLVGLYQNPYVHIVRCSVPLSQRHTAEPAYRVGELIATSHPVIPEVPSLADELVHKIHRLEKGYVVHDVTEAFVYVASAPTYPDETWIVPRTARGGFIQAEAKALREAAELLEWLFVRLRDEFPKNEYVLELHVNFEQDDEAAWWIRVYKQPGTTEAGLTAQMYPEVLAHTLKRR